MPRKQTPNKKGLRLYPPPSKDFDPFAATKKDFIRHGLGLRPDPQTQPGMAALWERQATRYRGFEHLEPQPDTATAAGKVATTSALGPDPIESCGYQLFSSSSPFIALFITWTVPNLRFTPSPSGTINRFHTFVGLGFLDVHVEMTVDPGQNVTSQITLGSGAQVNLPVRPGDWMNVMLCLQTNPAGTAAFFLTNETTRQRTNFSIDTGFPPAVTITAGISRGVTQTPFNPLADFGTVYFDELSAFTTSGTRLLVDGTATSMVDNGVIIARPVRLNDFAFRIDHA